MVAALAAEMMEAEGMSKKFVDLNNTHEPDLGDFLAPLAYFS